ncbi:MAG: hypothetical protein SH850_16070 [Planctomycetaceae bacterium]|nr:hypothetical protein [Planctomycetaceae bacterium]
MNRELLKSVMQAIGEKSLPKLDALVRRIIDHERAMGHPSVARDLEAAFRTARVESDSTIGQSQVLGEWLTFLQKVDPARLSHQFVISTAVEAQLAKIEQQHVRRNELMSFGLTPCRRVLVFGPAGMGKRLVAERFAHQLGMPLLRLDAKLVEASLSIGSLNLFAQAIADARRQESVLTFDATISGPTFQLSGIALGSFRRIVQEHDADGLLLVSLDGETVEDAVRELFDEVIEMTWLGETEVASLLKLGAGRVRLADNACTDCVMQSLKGHSASTIYALGRELAKEAVLTGSGVITKTQFEHRMSRLPSSPLSSAIVKTR